MEEKKMRIGDEETAILQIQRSQSDPHKALAEIIENSIDAKAKSIQIIRTKFKGGIEIIIEDNGEGVRPGPDGNCDMDRIPVSICDSVKRKLAEKEKEHVIGEFAIGLLGFSAIGKYLEMASVTKGATKTKYLTLTAGSINYNSGISHNYSPQDTGTRIRIFPVHENIANRLTTEKLCKYLGEELSERIKSTQVKIHISDKIRKKEIEVKSQNYKGEKIVDQSVQTPSGNIKVKLYIVQQGETGIVSLYRRGTKVLDEITEIDEISHFPWNSPSLEGLIDSRFINVPPATRRGVLPDTYLGELVEALISIEKIVSDKLKEAEIKRGEQVSRDMIRILRDSFINIMQELSDDYNWFNVKGQLKIPGGNPNNPVLPRGPYKKRYIPIANGPLSFINVTPKIIQMIPGEIKEFIADAWTEKGELIPLHVEYRWNMHPIGLGILEKNDSKCVFKAGSEEGELIINVSANLKTEPSKIVKTTATIMILKSKTTISRGGHSGFPVPKSIDKPAESWRSRWNESIQVIEYNIGHKDYKNAEKKGKRYLLKYFASLYAKQLVLHNFKTTGEENVLERLIEVLNTLEDKIKTS